MKDCRRQERGRWFASSVKARGSKFAGGEVRSVMKTEANQVRSSGMGFFGGWSAGIVEGDALVVAVSLVGAGCLVVEGFGGAGGSRFGWVGKEIGFLD